MAIITALRTSRGRGKRVTVSLNGRFAFSLEAEVAVKEKLEVGQELTGGRIEALARSDEFQRCLDAAARYVSEGLSAGAAARTEIPLSPINARRGVRPPKAACAGPHIKEGVRPPKAACAGPHVTEGVRQASPAPAALKSAENDN